MKSVPSYENKMWIAAWFAAAAMLLCPSGAAAARIRDAIATPTVTSQAAGASSQQTASAPGIREVTDEVGRTIQLPQSIHRVVSLAPSLTETLYALGVQDLLVGDTDYCDYPPAARMKPKVGGATNPSLEAIAALHPDVVLVTKSLNRLDTVRALADLGIPSYSTDPHTIADILASTQRVADLLGANDSGMAVTRELEKRLDNTRQKIANLPQRRVLFVVWPQPLISIGKSTFLADALLYAGAVSIIDSSQDWPRISLEDVVHQQPDYLIFAQSHSNGAPAEFDTLLNQPGWRILEATKNHRVALVSDAINRPAPRIVSVIEDLARQLHPEAFADSPRSEVEPQAPSAFQFAPDSLPSSTATCSLCRSLSTRFPENACSL